MASYASIGLLTGFGKGVAQMGDTLFKQHLIEAEAKRKEHLEELRYKRDRADKLADYEMAREDRREDEKIKRGEAMQDTIWQTNFKQAMDTAKTDAERAEIARLLEGESDPMKQAEKLRTAGFLDAATKVTASVPKPTETELDPKTKTIVELLKTDMDTFGEQMSDPELSPDERERARSKYEEARRELYKMVGAPVPATSEGAGGDLTAIADRIQSQMGKGEAGSTTKTEPADVARTDAGSSRSAGLLKQEPPSGNEPTYSSYSGNIFSTMMQRAGEYSGISAAENLIEAERQGKPYATSDIQAVAEAVMEQKIALKDLPNNVQQAVISAINRNR